MKILPIKLSEIKEQDSVFLIELYKIFLHTGEYRITNCDEKITFNGEDYYPIPITRGSKKETVDSKIDNCTLEISNIDNSFTAALFSGYDFRGCKVAIIQISYPESLDDPTLYRPVFLGEIDSPVLEEGDNPKFTVQLSVSGFNRLSPNRKCQLSCNAEFADPDDCGVVKDKKTGIITSASTNSEIYCSTLTQREDYWKYGIINIGGESRMIVSFKNGIIKVDYPFFATPFGNFSIETGCDKTFTTCDTKYNNAANYSGFIAIPYEYVVKS